VLTVQVQARGRGRADGVVALRAADAGVRRDAGAWLLSGVARRGEAMWFRVEHATRDELVGIAVLVRRDDASFAEVGFTCVGRDREERAVWSLVRPDVR
jgi:hypothetical protein